MFEVSILSLEVVMGSSESIDKKTRFSGFGIASIVVGVLALGLYMLINFVNPQSVYSPIFAAIPACLGLILNLYGIYLAINGYRKGDKFFSLLGALLNCFPVTAFIITKYSLS